MVGVVALYKGTSAYLAEGERQGVTPLPPEVIGGTATPAILGDLPESHLLFPDAVKLATAENSTVVPRSQGTETLARDFRARVGGTGGMGAAGGG